MKHCHACGKENSDTAKFCIGCGTRLPESEAVPVQNTDPIVFTETTVSASPAEPEPVCPEPVSPEPVTPPVSPVSDVQPAAPQPVPVRPVTTVPGADRKRHRLKPVLASGTALVIAICFTLLLLLTISSAVSLPNLLASYARDLIDLAEEYVGDASAKAEEFFGYELDAEALLDALQDALSTQRVTARAVSSALFSNLGLILIVAAVWLIYGSAKSVKNPCCGTAGIVILRIVYILRQIRNWLLAVLFVALPLLGRLWLASSEELADYYPQISEYLLYAAIAFAVIFLLIILYYGGILRSLKAIKAVAQGKACKKKISVYAIIVLYLGGVLRILSALALIFAAIFVSGYVFLPAFSAVVTAVQKFSTGTLLIRCRKALKN